MATMVLYMTDVQEVVVEETPEYTLENYMSDVGGAAGLILGNRDPRAFGDHFSRSRFMDL